MFPPHREIKPVLSGSSSSPERYGAFTEKRIKVYAKKETKFWAGDMNGGKNISGDQLRFSWHPSLFESRGITQVNLENVEKRKTSCETLKICYWNVIPAVGWTLPRLVGCHDWIIVDFHMTILRFFSVNAPNEVDNAFALILKEIIQLLLQKVSSCSLTAS